MRRWEVQRGGRLVAAKGRRPDQHSLGSSGVSVHVVGECSRTTFFPKVYVVVSFQPALSTIVFFITTPAFGRRGRESAHLEFS